MEAQLPLSSGHRTVGVLVFTHAASPFTQSAGERARHKSSSMTSKESEIKQNWFID